MAQLPDHVINIKKGLNLNDTSIDITKEVIEKEFKNKTQKEWIETFKDLGYLRKFIPFDTFFYFIIFNY